MADRPEPGFWKRKPLGEMSPDEWEAVCDGCAKCCLLKLEEEETGEIAYTRLHCRLLDEKTCRCSNYPERKKHVADCVILTPATVGELRWMPESCAYRLLHEGKPLPYWHHLVCGDRMEIHRRGKSILGKTVSEDEVIDEDHVDWILDWGEEDV